jgi:hypothetical protein
VKPAELLVEARRSFKEVELPAAEAEIRTECRRCLRCDLEWASQVAAAAPPTAAVDAQTAL